MMRRLSLGKYRAFPARERFVTINRYTRLTTARVALLQICRQ